MAQKYRHGHTSVTLINYHFVWCPRRRRKVLIGAVEPIDVKVVDLEVMPDHVHAFLNCPPTLAPYQVMHKVKDYTARHLRRREFFELTKPPSMWTSNYFCSTAGNVSSSTIEGYIAEQKTRG